MESDFCSIDWVSILAIVLLLGLFAGVIVCKVMHPALPDATEMFKSLFDDEEDDDYLSDDETLVTQFVERFDQDEALKHKFAQHAKTPATD